MDKFSHGYILMTSVDFKNKKSNAEECFFLIQATDSEKKVNTTNLM